MLWGRPAARSPAALDARCYDHFYSARRDVAFYLELAREQGGPVLELGCGTGRILVPVAAAGTPIVGVDLSAERLEICRRKLRRAGAETAARVTLLQGDMRTEPGAGTFRLAWFPFRSLQELVTDDDRLACLRHVRGLLAADGLVLVDVFEPSARLLSAPLGVVAGPSAPYLLDDGTIVRRTDRAVGRDLERQLQTTETVYDVVHPDGRSEQAVVGTTAAYLYRDELVDLLSRAGFEVVEMWGDYDRVPVGTRDPGELIALARPTGPGR